MLKKIIVGGGAGCWLQVSGNTGFREYRIPCNLKLVTVFILLMDFSLQHSTFNLQYSTFEI
jgi:hypothetical protein